MKKKTITVKNLECCLLRENKDIIGNNPICKSDFKR